MFEKKAKQRELDFVRTDLWRIEERKADKDMVVELMYEVETLKKDVERLLKIIDNSSFGKQG